MSNVVRRLEAIDTKMTFIAEIIESYGSITQALADQRQGAAAIFMHLTAIAEQFDKLSKEGEFEVLQHFEKRDLKGTYDIRTYIVHEYDGINYAVIERVQREKIPQMHESVKALLKEYRDSNNG